MNDVVEKLREIGVIQRGSFKMKSGKMSSIYFDLRRLYSYPEIFNMVIDKMGEMTGLDFDLVCGVPMAGVPYATLFSCRFKIPLILLRTDKKDHGTRKLIEGVYKEGDRVLLLEDVVTTGGSLEEAKHKLESEGLVVTLSAVVIDRREPNIKNNCIQGLLSMETMLQRRFYSKTSTDIWATVQRKKSNLCYSCDGGSVELLRLIAPYVCMVKIHMDIGLTWLLDIYDLALEYDFHVLDDRKYADIGSIVSKQSLESSLCTAHSIFGQTTIDGLKRGMNNALNAGCFLIAQCSSASDLITPLYTEMTRELAVENKEFVAGFITQEFLGDDGFLHLTPGVNNNVSSDSIGQSYRTVEEAVVKQRCDIIIVGRGIYDAPDPVASARSYRDLGWAALQERN